MSRETESEPRAAGPLGDGETRPPVVLIVDDDVAVRLMARAAVEQAGFAVQEAADGRAAVDEFERCSPDIVLLDIMMPVMDGFAACTELRTLPYGGHTPVIMMTGLDDIESINRAYDAGATDFVTKPINYSILKHRLRYVLRAKETADELRKSEGLLANAQRIAKIGHWEWDTRTDTAQCSEVVREIFGFPNGGMTFDDFIARVEESDQDSVWELIGQSLKEGKDYSLEHRVRRADGTLSIVQQDAEVLVGDEGEVVGAMGTVQDVTERREAEERIRHLVYYDALTGLPNRSLLLAHLEQAIANAKRYERAVAVLCVDLDNFKRFNDTLGLGAGDQLLLQVAERLQGSLRDSDCLSRNPIDDPALFPGASGGDTVARLGGDEFVLVLTQIDEVEAAAVVARRIADSLSEPFAVAGNDLYVTASTGISAYPLDSDNPDALLKFANVAMYHAKEAGRNRYHYYTESIDERTHKKFTIENHLRKALAIDELELHYQPKIQARDGKPVGIEALARWNHSELGDVSPGEFIPIAEETGLIATLGEWVLRTACRQNAEWQTSGLPGLVVSVNLSASQFRHGDLGKMVGEVLAETGLDPSLLELELTENVLMDDTDNSMRTLSQIRAMGVGISIDDYGTGYSSLSYLKRFPVTALKLDQSLVRDLAANPDDAAIVTSTISLAHSLRLKVVAEGVEEAEQLDFLRAHDCDEIQGYYFSPALAASVLQRWVEEQTPLLADAARAVSK